MNIKNPSDKTTPITQALNLEAKIGIRAFVWIGAIALAWAGILMVKYSLNQGWISPPLRIAFGILLGIAFLVIGEWTRSHVFRISQAFSSAGIADLYASFLAAHHLYHLIGTSTAFFFLALTTFVGVLLSLRQGSITAILGLLGGFLTPLWISSSHPDPVILFSYLFLLQTGLLIITRIRRWWPLAIVTLLAGNIWAICWLLYFFQSGHAPYVGMFSFFSMISIFFLTRSANGQKAWGSEEICMGLRWVAALTGLFQIVVLTIVDQYAPFEWLLFGVIGCLLFVLGRKNNSYLQISWLVPGIVVSLFLMWSGSGDPAFLKTVLILGLLFAGGAYLAMWDSQKPVHYAALSVCSAVSFFLIAYLEDGFSTSTLSWSVYSLFCGALYIVAAVPVVRRCEVLRNGYKILAALALGATTFLSFAIPIELKKEWLAVAWSLESLAVLWIASRLRVPALRNISLTVAILAAIRLILPPGFTFNWYELLYAYGIPILVFWQAATLSQREKHTDLSGVFQILALLLAFLLCTLEVRILFHQDGLWGPILSVVEGGAISMTWILLALFLRTIGNKYSIQIVKQSSRAILLAAITQTTLTQILFKNPLWVHIPIGNTPIFNDLFIGYGTPAIAYTLAALFLKRPEEKWGRWLSGAFSLLLFFLLLNMEVRQFFHGTYLDAGPTTGLEKYSYSLTWILFASLLLMIGMLRRSLFVRYCSLFVMSMAVVKVFLYDTGHLNDLYRFFAFFGLGLSLLLVAYMYHRFFLKTKAFHERS